jgi:hypothetical protein
MLFFTAAPSGAQAVGGGARGAQTILAGVVMPPVAVPADEARATCPVTIDSSATAYEIVGPHGATRFAQTCTVGEFSDLGRAGGAAYSYVRYRLTSEFTAEDSARGPQARDTVPEEVVILFRDGDTPRQRLAVWQMRYEVGPYGVLRSITPRVADESAGVLLSVQECVNGTGGCGQDLLYFRRGTWAPVTETWWGQLPGNIRDRILHGMLIDPRTLRAEGGLYRGTDPNCCPSDLLTAQLRLVGDSLVLESHQIRPQPR